MKNVDHEKRNRFSRVDRRPVFKTKLEVRADKILQGVEGPRSKLKIKRKKRRVMR